MRRIRVVEVLEATVGGTRRHLLDLLDSLDRSRFEMTAVVSLKRDPGFAREVARLRAEGIEVVTIPMLRRPAPIADCIALFRLCRVLERGRFDVVHAHSSKAGFLVRLAARIVGVPAVVYTPHGFAFMIRTNRLLRGLYRLAERLARPWTDLFVLVSPTEIEAAYETRLWPRAAPPHPLFVMIENGIDPDTVSRDRDAARAALGLGDDDLVIGSVGRLTRQKCHRCLIDAAQRVVSVLPSAKFVIIGEGELRPSLQRQIDRLGLGDRLRHRPKQLSGGEQQRVAIARALMNSPQILLADEPTGNLDSRTGAQIIKLLKQLNAETEQTIVMVTHDQALADLAGRVLHLRDGRLH